MKINNEQNQDTVLQFDELIEVSDKKPQLTPVKDKKQS